MKRLVLLVAFVLTLSTAAMAAEVPPTIPHPGINGTNGFRFGVTNLDTPELLWQAPYLYTTPYVSNTGWLAGDRVGYGCAYTFLEHEGEIVGRVTFRAIPDAASYMRINDTYMDEGERYYDGSPTPPGTVQVPAFECPAVSESYAPSTADERPVVVYWQGDTALEIRDYRTIDAAPGVTFDVVAEIREPFQVTSSVSGVHTVNDRITVVAMDQGVPVAVVYYDGLGTGSMFPTEEPVPTDDCNVIVSMSQGAQVYGAQGFNSPPSPLEGLTGEDWMLLVSSGKMLPWWTVPANWDTLGERHRCGTNAEIDRVLFIFDPALSRTMAADLNKVLAIIAARYPNAEPQLSLLVGGEGHVVCRINGQNVRASQTHAARIGEMTMAEAGPDLDVPCSGYADRIGHLTAAGAVDAQSQVAAFYGGGG